MNMTGGQRLDEDEPGHGSGGSSCLRARGTRGSTSFPQWLAIVWTLVFIAILVIHARHVLRQSGPAAATGTPATC